MDHVPSIVVKCPVCATQLRIPLEFMGKEGACKTCGCRFTPPALGVPEAPPNAPHDAKDNSTLRWAVLLVLAYGPALVLVPLSIGVGAAGTPFGMRLSVMNTLMVLPLTYCLIAGLYNPSVLERIFKVSIDRKQVAAIFAPLLLIELLCALGTYSP